ncbi:MAG TPA: pantetheine-phosphate adenylyltransferase [Candidatus Nanoarchaeia archaeon]|nr:pantetheine-phosphate adenylyltransferase [Candidatus Nanoarchaeia archaeon]
MKKAVYGGSFDPPTNGHLWMISEGARLFDQLIVSAAINPEKGPSRFNLEERLGMLKEITSSLSNVSVAIFEDKYLVKYAESVGANYIIRGLRTDEDYEWERRMYHFNRKLNPNIVTVFLMPPADLEGISSSFVMGLIKPEGWEEVIKDLVPEPVYRKILEKFKGVRLG